jgi:hypothetical protein
MPNSSEPHAFYRLLRIEPPIATKLGVGGEEVFGYGAAFERELKRIGQISPEQFGAMFRPARTIFRAFRGTRRQRAVLGPLQRESGFMNEGKRGKIRGSASRLAAQ